MTQQPFRLDGSIALVTGGASGIGAATCRQLSAAGATVLVADLDFKGATETAGTLCGGHAVEMDVTSPSSIAAVVADLDQLDILVNNAGIGHVGTVATATAEDFDRVM